MANLKPVLKSDFVKADGKCNIKIRVSHDGKVRYISTPWDIEPEFWSEEGFVKNKYPGHLQLNKAINDLLIEMTAELEGIGTAIRFMDMKTLLNRLKSCSGSGENFFLYAKNRIKVLKKENRTSYSISYESTIAQLEHCTGKTSLAFREITPQFLKSFEDYLSREDKKVNTIKVYMVNIRAIYNHAIMNGTAKIELFPFKKYKVKSEKPMKRSLELIEIQKLMVGPYFIGQQRAVDIFMLIFYLAGINIKDLLYLKPTDFNIKKGRITYKRAKTGGGFDIKVFPPALEIINKYKGTKYLLNFLDEDDSFEHYKSISKYTNMWLRKAAKYAGLTEHISTYTARHSFATTARKEGVSYDDVKMALGHDQRSVTDRYINYDMLRTQVDEAQKKVIDAVLKQKAVTPVAVLEK